MFGPYSHYYNGMMVGMPHQNPVPPTAHHPNPHQLSGHQPSHSWNQNPGFLNSGKIFLGKSLANVVSFYKDFTAADSTNADSTKADSTMSDFISVNSTNFQSHSFDLP